MNEAHNKRRSSGYVTLIISLVLSGPQIIRLTQWHPPSEVWKKKSVDFTLWIWIISQNHTFFKAMLWSSPLSAEKTETLRNCPELHSEWAAWTTPCFLMTFHPPQGPTQLDKMMESRIPRADVENGELSSVFTSYLLNICKENWPYSFVFIPFRNITQSIYPLPKINYNKKNLADSSLVINISLLWTTFPFLVANCWYLH